jgi:hypothetical protein
MAPTRVADILGMLKTLVRKEGNSARWAKMGFSSHTQCQYGSAGTGARRRAGVALFIAADWFNNFVDILGRAASISTDGVRPLS